MNEYFVHDYSQEMGRIFGTPVYWYGAVYTIGFVGIFLWLFVRRNRIGLNRRDVFEFMVFVATGILIGGRVFDIAVYEFEYYRQHPLDSLNWWKGGLASHGVLIGSATAVILFCWLRQKPFVRIADELVVPAAFLFAVGRIGNFIEGGVIGAPTNVPWAFIYEGLVEPRHPVALYESMKNFLIVPILILILRRYPAGISAFVDHPGRGA